MILVALLALLGLALSIPFVLCYVQVHRPKLPNSEAPDAFDLPYEEVHFPAAKDGLEVSGWFIPSAGSDATVLLCHGLGANKSNFLSAVPFLHQAGYKTLIFDFRGHGDSAGHIASFNRYAADGITVIDPHTLPTSSTP